MLKYALLALQKIVYVLLMTLHVRLAEWNAFLRKKYVMGLTIAKIVQMNIIVLNVEGLTSTGSTVVIINMTALPLIGDATAKQTVMMDLMKWTVVTHQQRKQAMTARKMNFNVVMVSGNKQLLMYIM